jgi:hypothetical protein
VLYVPHGAKEQGLRLQHASMNDRRTTGGVGAHIPTNRIKVVEAVGRCPALGPATTCGRRCAIPLRLMWVFARRLQTSLPRWCSQDDAEWVRHGVGNSMTSRPARAVLTLLAAIACLIDPARTPITAATRMAVENATQPAGGTPSDAYVAFRFDADRVVAVIAVLDDAIVAATGLSAEPAAQYGFPYFDAPDDVGAAVPPRLRSQREWSVHISPGEVVRATADRVVAGSVSCQQAAAVLLTIAAADRARFRSVGEKYFVAEPRAANRAVTAAKWGLGALKGAAVAPAVAQRLEGLLGDVLERELPKIREETADEIARMSSSSVDYHRRWATERRAADEHLARGNVQLSYDVQAFRLGPGTGITYFVRAQWLAGGTPAFAAALWLRGDPLEIIEADTSAASWLRMFEFQGRVDAIQLGQVLNVIDRNGDGWAEVIMARGGYESLAIAVQAYSSGGFVPEDISFASGC